MSQERVSSFARVVCATICDSFPLESLAAGTFKALSKNWVTLPPAGGVTPEAACEAPVNMKELLGVTLRFFFHTLLAHHQTSRLAVSIYSTREDPDAVQLPTGGPEPADKDRDDPDPRETQVIVPSGLIFPTAPVPVQSLLCTPPIVDVVGGGGWNVEGIPARLE